jgi:threonine aldolase
MPAARVIDLRSDTVTQPTPPMRDAMAHADVGDDVFGDDPTVNALEQRVADMFAMEAAIFGPSGTMANQIAIRVHTEPGSEIICHRLSHVYQYEGGAPAALAGCSFALLEGDRGMFTGEDVRGAVRADDPHFPRSALVVIENTQNRGGGAVWPLAQLEEVATAAHAVSLKVHLDGARLMNACLASGNTPAQYAAPCDSATLCFSKGLGAPVGSALAGNRAFIAKARRIRKMYGGGMRQAGILAAAGMYALDHNVARLADDHARARQLAQLLRASPKLEVEEPETNIVYFNVRSGDAKILASRLKDAGVWLIAVGPQRIRAVMHLHISDEDVATAAATIVKNA